MSARDCKSCDYFVDSSHSVGTCRRYPQFQTRSLNDWCGEFTPVPYAEPVPDMLALPVLENLETSCEHWPKGWCSW